MRKLGQMTVAPRSVIMGNLQWKMAVQNGGMPAYLWCERQQGK
jgi:hypothetical protein